MSTTRDSFERRRDQLLIPRSYKSPRDLAKDIVELMELLAIHGSTGIEGDSKKRLEHVDVLERRIIGSYKSNS